MAVVLAIYSRSDWPRYARDAVQRQEANSLGETAFASPSPGLLRNQSLPSPALMRSPSNIAQRSNSFGSPRSGLAVQELAADGPNLSLDPSNGIVMNIEEQA
mmetsp:Transcript_101781/g.287068  ORF Transcript_101781/g.287068 Transcript_101781/m.287068 type:complete len:102 (+) Transcript_101781:1204-1509(+)